MTDLSFRDLFSQQEGYPRIEDYPGSLDLVMKGWVINPVHGTKLNCRRIGLIIHICKLDKSLEVSEKAIKASSENSETILKSKRSTRQGLKSKQKSSQNAVHKFAPNFEIVTKQ